MKRRKGKKYKWTVEKGYQVLHLGSLLDNYQCKYDPMTRNLSITNLDYKESESFNFKCADIESAKVIVKSFADGMSVDVLREFKL